MKKVLSLILIISILISSALYLNAEDFLYTSVASQEEWTLLNELNAYRTENGKKPVTMLVSLQDACGLRSKELLDSLSHYRPDGTPWYSLLESNGIEYNTESFEIIATNFTEPKKLLDTLSSRENDKEKLLSDYSHIGIGFSSSDKSANSTAFCLIGINCREEGNIRLCNTANIHLAYGDTTDKLDIMLKKSCSHGNGYIKVLSSMIEGHDPFSTGTCELNVKYENTLYPFDIIIDYTDSKPGAWYYEAVLNCTDNKLFSGVGKGTFGVKSEMTREMFVTVLGRFAKVDIVQYPGSSFDDVKVGQWYSPYVEWASENGIVSGNGKGKFNGSMAITRQEICVILCNYMKKDNIKLPQLNAAFDFSDESSIASWALDSVSYCQTRGIVSGNTKGQFLPVNNASRAEVAVIFNNFHKAVNN